MKLNTNPKLLSSTKPLGLLWCTIGCVLATVASSCRVFDPIDWSDGTYIVTTIDIGHRLAYDLGDNASIGRVSEDVVAVGSDDQFVVAKQEDIENDGLVQYYYIVKADDDRFFNHDEITQGPFTASEFNMLTDELGLPALTEEF